VADTRIYQLLNRELDGDLTPDERAELEQALAADESARRVRSHMQGMHKTLKDMPQIEPPSAMKANIMRSINPPGLRQAIWPVRIFRQISAWFEVRPIYPYAVGVATGLLVFAVYVGTVDRSSQLNDGDLAATLLHQDEASTQAIHVQPFEVAGTRGSVASRHADGVIWVDLTLETTAQTGIEMTFNERELQFRALSKDPDAAMSFNQADGHIEISQIDPGTYHLAFTGSPGETSRMSLTVRSGAETVQTAITLGRSSAAAETE